MSAPKTDSLTIEQKTAYYEKNKLNNFIASSKLEGLNLTEHSLSIDEVVKKYTRPHPASHTANNAIDNA